MFDRSKLSPEMKKLLGNRVLRVLETDLADPKSHWRRSLARNIGSGEPLQEAVSEAFLLCGSGAGLKSWERLKSARDSLPEEFYSMWEGY